MIDLVKNVAYNKISFYLSIILWVYGKKVQVRALVDSGATIIFINKSVVESNNLAKEKLAESFGVTNADGTENQGGTIIHFVKVYLEIGLHNWIYFISISIKY